MSLLEILLPYIINIVVLLVFFSLVPVIIATLIRSIIHDRGYKLNIYHWLGAFATALCYTAMNSL